MQILDELRKTAEFQKDRSITVDKQKEELEWHWLKKIYKGTKALMVERASISATTILKQDK